MDLTSLFAPKTIALVGASANPKKLGYQLLSKLKTSNLKLFPVNPHEYLIQGLKAYPTLLDIPGAVDLVIVAVPAQIVNQIATQAVAKKVKSLVIISAGFSETGKIGHELELTLQKTCQKAGINLLGPNVLGFANPRKQLDITFAKTAPPSGNIGLISQSGAIGSFLFDWAKSENLGFSLFVSLGNRAGLTETDFLTYLSQDPNTKVIGLYLESFADGKKFMKTASQVTLKKPLIVIFGGQTQVGKKAALSHTAALSPQIEIIKTALDQSGCIQAENLENFTDLLEIFSLEPKLIDHDLVIITNAGGPGILASDQAFQSQLEITPLSLSTAEKLKTAVPQAQINNPIDLIGDAMADRFQKALSVIVQDQLKDAFLIILTPQTNTQLELTAEIIVKQFKHLNKPVVVSFLGGDVNDQAKDILQKRHIATIDFPQKAVNYLSTLYHYWHLRRKNLHYPVKKSIRLKSSRETLALFDSLPSGQCTWHQITKLASTYHLPLVSTKIVEINQLPHQLKNIGFPAVLKADPAEALHRTEKQGLYLNLNSLSSVKSAFNKLKTNFKTILLQPQLHAGHELFIGLKRYAGFPPLLTLGSGGIYTEIYQDIIHAFLPINQKLIKKLFSQIKIGLILQGARGLPPVNLTEVYKMILNLCQLVEDLPQIDEINCNPAIITPDSINIVDLKIKVSEIKSPLHL
ncbi:MAG: acetate--CoA ligase family protein [Candidatus Beckwithbacteria bacterium]